ERRHIVDACPVRKVVEGLRARAAGAQLEVDQPQFVRKVRVGERELVADALNGLVEAEAGFNADDEKIERVRQRKTDAMLPLLRLPAEDHARQQVPEARRTK